MSPEEASRLLDSHVAVLANYFSAIQIIAKLPDEAIVSSRKGGRINMSLAERFWSKVDRSGGDDSCWRWTGHRTPHGHGTINIGGDKREYAHRLAWILTNGPIPKRLCVCHKCDNPPCCNPRHFFLGTHAENTADMVSKGRAHGGRTCGAANNRTKLSENQVKEIRRLYDEEGLTQREIGARFGIGQTGVSAVLRGKCWKYVA